MQSDRAKTCTAPVRPAAPPYGYYAELPCGALRSSSRPAELPCGALHSNSRPATPNMATMQSYRPTATMHSYRAEPCIVAPVLPPASSWLLSTATVQNPA